MGDSWRRADRRFRRRAAVPGQRPGRGTWGGARQRRHGEPPADGGLGPERDRAAAGADRRRIPARPALARRDAGRPARHRARGGVRRDHAGDRGPGGDHRPRRARPAAAAAANRRRRARGPALPRGRLPRPGRLQGADPGAAADHVRPPPRPVGESFGPISGKAHPPAGGGAGWGAPRGARSSTTHSRASSGSPERRRSTSSSSTCPAPRRCVAALRRAAVPIAITLAIAALLTIPEWGRIVTFTGFGAFDPAGEQTGLGNLRQALSPLEALGVWPSGEFRLSPADASLPAAAFYLAGLLGAAAVGVGIAVAIRRRRDDADGLAILAAFVAAAVIYLGAAIAGTPYTSAKALAIAAAPAMLLPLRALLSRGAISNLIAGRHRLLAPAATAFALAFVLAAGISSFLALRQAPVSVAAHPDELAQIRPLVAGDPVLFLGRDDFIAWHLRGSPVSTHIKNFFSTGKVPARVDPEDGEKFDFDAVSPETLDDFDWVLTSSTAYASDPPENFEVAERTPSYALWERTGTTAAREILGEGTAPGLRAGCFVPGVTSGDLVRPAGRGLRVRLAPVGDDRTRPDRDPVARARHGELGALARLRQPPAGHPEGLGAGPQPAPPHPARQPRLPRTDAALPGGRDARPPPRGHIRGRGDARRGAPCRPSARGRGRGPPARALRGRYERPRRGAHGPPPVRGLRRLVPHGLTSPEKVPP